MHRPAHPLCSKLLCSAVIGAGIFLSVCSCAQTGSAISAVDAKIIFDYASETAAPEQTLSVFVQPTYDAERVASVSVEHLESGYTWTQTNPQILSVRNAKSWTGYRNFRSIAGQSIPAGRYECRCSDAASDVVTAGFSVSYPEELLTLTQSQAEDFLKQTAVTRYTALYDADGVLVYYGEEDFDINKYATARTKRTILSCYDGNVICVLSRQDLH